MAPMDADDPLHAYIEEVALHFEAGGLPRIAGRILGLLLVCDPPHRSYVQLADELGASKGSISTMTRMLLASGLLEIVPVPGERGTYVRLSDDGFEALFAHKIQQLVSFRPLAAKGLGVLAREGASDAQAQRLRILTALYTFYETEMPAMLERWREQRDALVAAVSTSEEER